MIGREANRRGLPSWEGWCLCIKWLNAARRPTPDPCGKCGHADPVPGNSLLDKKMAFWMLSIGRRA